MGRNVAVNETLTEIGGTLLVKSTGRVRVESGAAIDGLKAAAVADLTDNSGGATADGTIGAVTAPTAIEATLTDSTGLSGSHDDTLAAVTTFTPSVAWDGAAVFPSAADATAIATAITTLNQNASDTAQKVIELVTAQGQDRTAIVALTDAVKELSTKVNEALAAIRAGGLMAS